MNSLVHTSTSLISDACLNAEKVPRALISCGVVQAAAALCLIVSKVPGGSIFLHNGKPPFYLYYGILIFGLVFGLIEASIGFWVSGDAVGRLAVGKTVLWVSILPTVIVAALWGLSSSSSM